MLDFYIITILICYSLTVVISVGLIWDIIHTMMSMLNQRENCTPGLAIFYLAIYMIIALCSTLFVISACVNIYRR